MAVDGILPKLPVVFSAEETYAPTATGLLSILF